MVGNKDIKEKLQSYIDTGEIPQLLFSGAPGTGKTTISRILMNKLSDETLFINASDENSVDTVRNKIKGFASSVGFSNYKIVVLDEADYISPNGQAALRRISEDFAKNTRFILTCNYHEKIIDALKSRFQMFTIKPLDLAQISSHVKQILVNENIQHDNSDIVKVVKKFHPDIRKIINVLEQNVNNDNVLILTDHALAQADFKISILKAFTSDNPIRNIRQIVADNNVNDFQELYSYLFNHIDEIVDDEEILPLMYIKIAEYQYRESFVVDKELQFSALIYDLVYNT